MKFDHAIIGAEYHRAGDGEVYEATIKSKKSVCTMVDYMEQLGYTKWPKLRELYYLLFEEDIDGAHNSLVDVKACARCYFKLLTEEYTLPKNAGHYDEYVGKEVDEEDYSGASDTLTEFNNR